MTIQVRSNETPVTPPTTMAENNSAGQERATQSQPNQESQTLSALETKTPEQNESPESETEETEAEPKESDESKDPENKGQEPTKKKGGFQRRIDKLNQRISAREQELEYWKQQALKNASATETKPQVTVPTTQTATADGKPKPENFETHTEYVEALTDWKTEQKLKERDQRAEKVRLETEQSKVVNSYTERMKAFAEKQTDFHDVLSDVDHVPLSPALKDIILTSENGPELAYELAKTPEEFERIAKLPPLACAREMGKLEVRLNLSSSKASAGSPETKKITQAPKPIEPVGTGGKGSAPKSIYDPNLSQQEYEAIRAKQRAKRTG